jgi:hypothetical protein
MVGVHMGEQHVVDVGRIDLCRGQIRCQTAGVRSQRIPATGVDHDL